MTLALRLSFGFAMACVLVYAATPYAILLADRLQFYDKPAGYKGHAHPTPYLGGAALMGGFVIAVLVAAGDWNKTIPLVGGVALLWVVGTVDDRRTVPPGWRVLVELALASIVWASGLGWHLGAGAFVDLGVTCVWIVAVVNAFNLFDNMDGAASTMALVVSAGAAILGVVRGDAWLAVGAVSLGGACLGFLPRNLSLPAQDLPRRRWQHAVGLCGRGAGDRCREHLGGGMAVVAGRASPGRDPGPRHVPCDRLAQASRRVDSHRRAGPSHPSRAQVPAERSRGRVDAGSRSGGRVRTGDPRQPGRLVVHRDRRDPLSARGGDRDHGPGDPAGRGVRRCGRGGRSGRGGGRHDEPSPGVAQSREILAGALANRARVPDRARPRRRAEPVLLRLLRRFCMGTSRLGDRARMRDEHRRAPDAPGRPHRAGPRRPARHGSVVSGFHRLGGICGERCGERQPMARLRRAAAAHAGAPAWRVALVGAAWGCRPGGGGGRDLGARASARRRPGSALPGRSPELPAWLHKRRGLPVRHGLLAVHGRRRGQAGGGGGSRRGAGRADGLSRAPLPIARHGAGDAWLVDPGGCARARSYPSHIRPAGCGRGGRGGRARPAAHL